MGLLQVIGSRYMVLALRLALGSVLVLAGTGKLVYVAEQVQLIEGYAILPLPLVLIDAYLRVLPWAEILTGCFLVMGLFSRFFAGASMFLIASFIGANAIFLYYGGNEDCGCFGQLLSMSYGEAMVVDVVMLVMASVILLCRIPFASVDYWCVERRKQ